MHAPRTPVRPPSCSPPSQNRSRQRLRHNEPRPWSPTTFSSFSPPISCPAFILMMVGHLQRKKVSSNTQVMTAVLRRVQAPASNKRRRPWAISFEFNWTPRAPSGTEGFVERAMCRVRHVVLRVRTKTYHHSVVRQGKESRRTCAKRQVRNRTD